MASCPVDGRFLSKIISDKSGEYGFPRTWVTRDSKKGTLFRGNPHSVLCEFDRGYWQVPSTGLGRLTL